MRAPLALLVTPLLLVQLLIGYCQQRVALPLQLLLQDLTRLLPELLMWCGAAGCRFPVGSGLVHLHITTFTAGSSSGACRGSSGDAVAGRSSGCAPLDKLCTRLLGGLGQLSGGAHPCLCQQLCSF